MPNITVETAQILNNSGETHTLVNTSGNNRKVIILLATEYASAGPILNLQYNGVAATAVRDDDASNGSQHNHTYIFMVDDADLPAGPGSYPITFSGGTDNNLLVIELSFAAQGAPVDSGGQVDLVNLAQLNYDFASTVVGDFIGATISEDAITGINAGGSFQASDLILSTLGKGAAYRLVEADDLTGGTFSATMWPNGGANRKSLSAVRVVTENPPFFLDTVDSDNEINVGQSDIVVAGGLMNTATQISIKSASVTQVQTIKAGASASQLTFDLTEASQAGLPYGALTMEATDGSNIRSVAITMLPATGNSYIVLNNPLPANNVNSILYNSNKDPETGFLVEWKDSANVSILEDGTAILNNGVTQVELRVWDNTDDTWSPWVIKVANLSASYTAPNIDVNKTSVIPNVSITSLSILTGTVTVQTLTPMDLCKTATTDGTNITLTPNDNIVGIMKADAVVTNGTDTETIPIVVNINEIDYSQPFDWIFSATSNVTLTASLPNGNSDQDTKTITVA